MAATRLGLIGAGLWGQVYLRTIASLGNRCRLTHLGSSNPASAKLVPGTVAILPRWQDVVRSECDAVIIATPPGTHADILDACFKAGKPCLVEKPLCLDVPTAERLMDQARASRVPVLVDHTHLFNPAYEEMRRRIRAGGEPVKLVITEGMDFGPFRSDASALWDWGPHDVSLCLDLLGTAPESVAGLAGARTAGGMPEAVSLYLRFAGDAMAWITVGRISPVKRRSMSVLTETGLYVFDDLAEPKLKVGRIGTAPVLDDVQGIPAESTMVRVLRYFLDGLTGGDRSRFGLELAVEVTRVLARADEAIQSQVRAG